jgi:hypothetical protein
MSKAATVKEMAKLFALGAATAGALYLSAGSSARSAAFETPHPLTGPRSNARTTPAFWRGNRADRRSSSHRLERMPGY